MFESGSRSANIGSRVVVSKGRRTAQTGRTTRPRGTAAGLAILVNIATTFAVQGVTLTSDEVPGLFFGQVLSGIRGRHLGNSIYVEIISTCSTGEDRPRLPSQGGKDIPKTRMCIEEICAASTASAPPIQFVCFFLFPVVPRNTCAILQRVAYFFGIAAPCAGFAAPARVAPPSSSSPA